MSELDELAKALGGGKRYRGGWLVCCCSHEDSDPSLSLRIGNNGTLLVHCFAECDPLEILSELRRRKLIKHDRQHDDGDRPRGAKTGSHDETDAERREKALWLWRQRKPLIGSLGERYLRDVRACRGALPATLGFKPAYKQYPPAVICAYGIPLEPQPGVLFVPDGAVMGVQLLNLVADGSAKAGKPTTIGRCLGSPIVLAPLNDNLGLAITEGVEDALSIHEATGLGAWAAGGGTRLAALADSVPDYTDWVTVARDDDPAGARGTHDLAAGLRARGINVEIVALGERL